jgi:hypothetical protein
MSTEGNSFGVHDIHWFNGGLFADDAVFDLTSADLGILSAAAALDWSTVEPAIFGTLFERSLDPGKRSQLGAHYTSKEDIMLIVEPVVMAPLEARWRQVKAESLELAEAAEQQKGPAYGKLRAQMQEKLYAWLEELSRVRVLDPACGSGNFLYLALRRMLDLWREVYIFSGEHGLPTLLPHQVRPSQLYGIETNVYAHELASVVVWIGYLQWLNDNSMGWPTEPILRKLDNIQHRDAILARGANGKAIEAAWPEAECIIGNPPFLGGSNIRAQLGDSYADELFGIYSGRIPASSDLVCYWFEHARKMIEIKRTKRIGLLATQGIRGGGNRTVLERIKETGDIFFAWSDRDWLLDGASVHVSMVGFDDGSETYKLLNGAIVSEINADLTDSIDLTSAIPLKENKGLWAYGSQQKAPFDIAFDLGLRFRAAPNPFGKCNADVVRRAINGKQLLQRLSDAWVIDFGENTHEAEAALYEEPFEYVRAVVFPLRENHREVRQRVKWWLHARPSPKYRRILATQSRYIATPVVSKHRVFVWLDGDVLVDHQIVVFAREDDYFIGVLQSRLHDVWSRRTGTQVREAESGFRYTPSSTFETFPFPWPPGHEPQGSPLVEAIAEATRELVEQRDKWLNPPDTSAEELKRRTLTNLYNARPAWLAEAHRKLDEAVFAAYGWPSTFTAVELLEHLLDLNHQRATSGSE